MVKELYTKAVKEIVKNPDGTETEILTKNKDGTLTAEAELYSRYNTKLVGKRGGRPMKFNENLYVFDYHQILKDFDDAIKGGRIDSEVVKNKEEIKESFKTFFDDYGGSDGKGINYSWFDDGDYQRKEIMKEYTILKLGGKLKPINKFDENGEPITLEGQDRIDRLNAERAFNRAEDLFIATGEDQFYNKDTLGPATMAKMMNLRFFRTIEYMKGKKAGPIVNLPLVERVATSYLRQISPNKDLSQSDFMKILKSDDVNVDSTFGKDTYNMWATTLMVNKFKLANKMFMSTEMKDFTQDQIHDMYDALDKVADFVPRCVNEKELWEEWFKGNKLAVKDKLAVAYVLGVLSNLTNIDNNIQLSQLKKFYYYFVANKDIPKLVADRKPDKVKRFMLKKGETGWVTLDCWNQCCEITNIYNRLHIKTIFMDSSAGKGALENVKIVPFNVK